MNTTSIKAAVILSLIAMLSCSKKESINLKSRQTSPEFNANSLIIKEDNHTRKIRGQLLYIPVYSNVPYHKSNKKFNLSAFVAIHNTDLNHPIRLTKVLFFNNEGKLVSNFLSKDTIIQPLGATNYFIPEHDQNGTGANFLVEWISDTLVNEPLIESVMLGTTSGQGVSFSSTGKVIRELK